MPPKGSKMPKKLAKGKAKAQGKAKGKAKAKAKAKAGKAAKTDRAIAPEIAVGENAESSEQKRPKAKAKAGFKRIFDAAVAGKPVDEAITEAKRRLHGVDATIAEAAALEEAQSSQAAAARKELDQAAREIGELIEEENAGLQRHAQIQLGKVKAAAEVDAKKRALLESTQVLSLLELETARKKKREAAENLQQMTKAALAGVKALKGVGRKSISKQADDESTSAKRTSAASSRSPEEDGTPKTACEEGDPPKTIKSSAMPDDADTVPATLQDDADDIE